MKILKMDIAGSGARSSAAAGKLERTQENKRLIQLSMKRWKDHNIYGRSIGRGLSEVELLDRVADETGASRAHIRLSLRKR